MERLHRAYQHSLRFINAAGHDIEMVMNPIYQEYIRNAGFSKHYFSSRSAPAPIAMRGTIGWPPIGFHFDDFRNQCFSFELMHQQLSQTIGCDHKHRTLVKTPREWLGYVHAQW